MTVPRVFGLPHLSEDAVAAFADGVLSDAATVRARKHCIECAECADAVRVQRETAMMLRCSSSPSAPAGLIDRLTHLPQSAPIPPPNSGLPTALGADGIPVFVAHNPPARKRPEPPEPGKAEDRHFHPRRALLPVGILASAAAVVAAGTLGGNATAAPQPGEPQQPAAVRPVADTLLTRQASSTPSFLPAHRVLAVAPRPDRP
ncbi:MAG TPA: hypothetical protein VHO01_15060 [Jatrophihabitans sp.]|nr:hypothetical protein [Jatrophihabitans sp.]